MVIASLTNTLSCTAPTPNPMNTTSLLYPQRVQTLPLRKEVSSLAAWPNRALSQIVSPRASLKPAEHPPINFFSRKDNFDTDFNDLATAAAASEIIDTTEVGQLNSPLFSQEREVSGNPFSVSGSQAHSNVWKPVQDTYLFTSIGKFCERHGFFGHWKPLRGVESFPNVEIVFAMVYKSCNASTDSRTPMRYLVPTTQRARHVLCDPDRLVILCFRTQDEHYDDL